MCLYSRLILNRKYIPNKKNNWEPPELKDERVKYVPIACGKCMECKKQKGRQWSVRLQEDIREDKRGKFVTLTFNTEALKTLKEEIKGLDGYELENEIATRAVRYFLERWRKQHGTSVKHWLVTELGQQNNEHIHIHGIIFTNTPKDIEKHWKMYGYTWIGDYVNERTINYCIKYSTKVDLKHKEYNAKILTSPGIGANYTKRLDARLNKYKPGATKETYTLRTGTKLNLPIYYRNKIYSEQEREKLWIEKLDKEERWVDGKKISTKNGTELYFKVLQLAREKNRRLGYGNDEKNWNRINYENDLRNIKMAKRLSEHHQKEIEQKKPAKTWEEELTRLYLRK